jgi:hypothetical protein
MSISVEVVTFSKIRFGDPITAIGIGKNSVMHGSIMGRLVYYSLERREEKEVVDIANEMVRDITLSEDEKSYFIANGDIGWHMYSEDGLSILRTFAVEVKGIHPDVCERSYTFQAKGYNCVLILSGEEELPTSKVNKAIGYNPYQGEDKIVFTNMETQVVSRVRNPDKDFLPYSAIPFDFDGERVM